MGGPNGENTAFGQRAVQTGRTRGSKREAFNKENDARDIFLASQNFGMRSLAQRHRPEKHVVVESIPSETEESKTFSNRRRRGSTMAARWPKKGRQASADGRSKQGNTTFGQRAVQTGKTRVFFSQVWI